MGCQSQKGPQGTPGLNYFQMKNLPLREGKGLSRNQRETEPGQGHGRHSRSTAHSGDKNCQNGSEQCWVQYVILGGHSADSSPSQHLWLMDQPPSTKRALPRHLPGPCPAVSANYI